LKAAAKVRLGPAIHVLQSFGQHSPLLLEPLVDRFGGGMILEMLDHNEKHLTSKNFWYPTTFIGSGVLTGQSLSEIKPTHYYDGDENKNYAKAFLIHVHALHFALT
jgi:hypothetical protein